MGTIIAICNQKGGVGKSTSASMIAAEIALRGYQTLLIDGDPQANATEIFLDPAKVERSLANVLLATSHGPSSLLIDQRLSTEIESLDIIPATLSLANFDREPPLAMTRLKQSLREVRDYYDFVVIDTPPNLGMLLTAALIACTHVLIPVQAAPFALSGLNDLLQIIEDTKASVNETLTVLGAFCTLYDTRTSVSGTSYLKLMEQMPNNVFTTIIHRQTKLEESPSMHQPVQLFAPQSRGAEQYASLTDEVLKKLGRTSKPQRLSLVKEVVNEQ